MATLLIPEEIHNTCSSGVPDHFSESISGNRATYTITGAQPEEEVDCHCMLYMESSIPQ